jgi:putative endonuclease
MPGVSAANGLDCFEHHPKRITVGNPLISTSKAAHRSFLCFMYFTYIIESQSTQKWYYGSTSDLERRLDGHNKGLNVSTKNRGPWKFIFVRPFQSQKEARAFEAYLKKTRNKDFIKRQFPEYFV